VLDPLLPNISAPESPVDQTGQPAVFIAKGLSKTYQMGEVKVHALRDVDLTIYRAEFIVLLGPSGSGKSTLLNILGGLDRPSGGVACFADQDLTTATEAQLTQYRRDHVGFVFQFYNLIPSLTVRENVELVTDIANHPMPAIEALVWSAGGPVGSLSVAALGRRTAACGHSTGDCEAPGGAVM